VDTSQISFDHPIGQQGKTTRLPFTSGFEVQLLNHPSVIAATGQRGREHKPGLSVLLLLPLQQDRSELTVERDIIFRCFGFGGTDTTVDDGSFYEHGASIEIETLPAQKLRLRRSGVPYTWPRSPFCGKALSTLLVKAEILRW
jgi:hypothetical protein